MAGAVIIIVLATTILISGGYCKRNYSCCYRHYKVKRVVSFDQSNNSSTLGTCNIYFVLGDADRSVYKLKDGVVNEATIDFEIDGIATINWSGQCSEVLISLVVHRLKY